MAKEASIERALKALNIPFARNSDIRIWRDVKSADFAIRTPFSFDIGLRKNGQGKFEIECDHMIWGEMARTKQRGAKTFWDKICDPDSSTQTKANFIGKLQQAYAIAEAITTAEEKGHRIELAEDENGVVHARVFAS